MRITRCTGVSFLRLIVSILVFSGTPAFAQFSTINVKAGATYTDSTGVVWSADTSNCTGGIQASTTHAITGALPAASDQALYQPERFRNSTCTFTAPAGTYAVTIKFSENFWTAAGQRLFNVSINGTTVLSAFDIFAAAGGQYKALDTTFLTTTTGSPITIQFINGSIDNAKYDSIQIAASGGPAPAPGITGVNPTSGVQGQSLAVVITGSNFQSGATCSFSTAGITVNSCVFNSGTQLTANITISGTATLGTGNVTVTNPDLQSATLPNAFTVNQAPAPGITGVNPTSGVQSQSLPVVITGSNFQSGATCSFSTAGITVNSCVFNSGTQLTANITISGTATMGTGNVTVTNPDLQSATLPNAFTVNQAPLFSTINVKAGATYTDSTGAVWSADTSNCTGGSQSSTTHAITGALPAASDQALYQPERFRNSTCTFTAPAGTYAVTIKFSENFWTAAGQRLFNVSINGTTVLSAFDIFAAAGGQYKALDTTFLTTTTGSPITIQFINGSIDNAKYDSIQIAASGGPAPAPGITGVNPTSGVQGQSLPVVITGSNFQSGATCSFSTAGITVNSCAFNSGTQLTANITISGTATLGAGNVTVTNPDLQSATLPNSFTVNQAPAPGITGVNPTSGSQGQSLAVVITGSNFQSGATCSFSNAGITVNSCVFNSATQLTANITISGTATLGTGNVTVTNPDLQSATLPSAFTVNQAPLFSTIRIKAGATYTDSTGAVWSADTSNCTGGSQSSTTHAITGALPAASDQALYQSERNRNSTCTFTAPAGTYAVTIKFSENFWTAAGQRLFNVAINGTTVLSAFDIFAAAGGQYKALDTTFLTTTTGSPITIQFINGSIDNAKYDSIQIAASGGPAPAPGITGVNPTSGVQGQSLAVVITGSNFQSGATCSFSTAGITVNSCVFNSATQLTANITISGTATLGTGNVTVTNPDLQSATLPNSFTVNQAPAPGITGVNPTSGSQGQSLAVVITGSNFQSGATCSFSIAGITVNSCVFNSATQLTANITISGTATLGTGNVTVTNPDLQSATLPNAFTVNQAPAPGITGVNPTSGAQGQALAVVITGSNFQSGATCSFSTAGITVNSCVFNSATQLTANITISGTATLGTGNVTVTNPDNQSATLPNGFSVNSFSTIRIKAGATYTDSTGAVWSADTSNCTGGSQSSTTHAITGALPAASDQALYQSEHNRNSTCTFTAPAGTYAVTIKFSENFWTAAGKRLFNVSINGTTVLSAFDIFAAAGGQYKALDTTFLLTTTGSPITIQFTNGSIDNAKYDSIQIAINNTGSAASVTPTAGTPQSAAINTTFGTALQATVKDASNNPATGVTVTFTAPSSGASGKFAGMLGTAYAITNGSGVATAPAFTANSTAGSYTVTAGVTGATSARFSLTNAAGTISGLSVTISPKRGGLTVTQSLLVSATVTNDVNAAGVTWSASGPACSGTACGTFVNATSTSATYIAPSTPGIYSIIATSVADVTKSASNSIGVTNLPGVFTYHNNLSRDGTNTNEFTLTTSNVNTSVFGKLFSCQTDGAIYAQPLWISNLMVGGSPHNVIVVATQHDSLYAFDADGPSCTQLWHVNLIDSAHGGTSGETPVPGTMVGSGFGDISPEVGVTGTPVIDPNTQILYVVSKSVNTSPTFFQRLHAIDLTTGNEVVTPHSIGSSISVAGTGAGAVSGRVAFDPRNEAQRPGLVLSNGVVYVSWASHEDKDPYHGWVIGFNASTLATVSVFNTTPNRTRGGIWMGGGAPAIDSTGNLYFITGNGSFDANTGGSSYGDSVVKLSTASGLSVSDYFTPLDQASLDSNDIDFGAGAATILVDQPTGSPVSHLIIGGGKQGHLFLVNRDNMGKFSSTTNNVIQNVNVGSSIYSTPAFWQNQLYVAGDGGALIQYIFNPTTGLLGAANSQSTTRYRFPGPTPSVSSNGTTNGIVWTLDNGSYCTAQSPSCGATVLHAYNAGNLATDLWNSSQAAGSRDVAGDAVKFAVPTVANGKVYVGTRGNNTTIVGELDVYGLLPN